MITPNNKAIIITFVALCQASYGWSVYLSVTYTQLGVPQDNEIEHIFILHHSSIV